MASSSSKNTGGLRPRFVVAVVCVVAIVCAGVFIVSSRTPQVEAQSVTAAEVQSAQREDLAQVSADSVSVCGLGASNVGVLGEHERLTLPNGVVVAKTPTGGPGVVRGSIPSCYAHSVEGAVFAASSYLTLVSRVDDVDEWRQFVGSRVFDDAARRFVLESVNSPDGLPARGWVYVHGYSVDTWDDTLDMVTVRLAFSVPEVRPDVFVMPVDLVWAKGDWKVIFRRDMGIEPVASVEGGGLTRWQI